MDEEQNPHAAVDRFRALLARRLAPDQAVAEMKAAIALHPKRGRAFQAQLLGQAFRDAAALAACCGWTGKVVLSGGKVMVDQDGALLSADREDRYFRTNGPFAGAAMLEGLAAFGIEPRTVLDVGANIGELSIYFARLLPDARIIAFEPAPENLRDFAANLELQDPPLTNLKIVAEAVSDRTGTIAFTVGAGDLNTTMVEGNLERLQASPGVTVAEVPTDTLENLCSRLGVDEIDLLKIDTEGGEPLLSASVRAMTGRIRAAYVEISTYNSLDAYAELIAAFDQAGMVMLDKTRRHRSDPIAWLAERLAASTAVNVWFVQREWLDRPAD